MDTSYIGPATNASTKRSEKIQNSLRFKRSTRNARFEKTSKRNVDVVEILKKSVGRTDLPPEHPGQTRSERSIEILSERKQGNWLTKLFTFSSNTTGPVGHGHHDDDDAMITASENSQNSILSMTRSARFQKTSRRDLDVMSMSSENSQNSLRYMARSARFQKTSRRDLDVMSMY
jgi:hypothetical protein